MDCLGNFWVEVGFFCIAYCNIRFEEGGVILEAVGELVEEPGGLPVEVASSYKEKISKCLLRLAFEIVILASSLGSSVNLGFKLELELGFKLGFKLDFELDFDLEIKLTR